MSSPQRKPKQTTFNYDSDLDKLLGSQESELKNNWNRRKANAGQNWLAYALPTAEEGYDF